jgi:hypothetical protein
VHGLGTVVAQLCNSRSARQERPDSPKLPKSLDIPAEYVETPKVADDDIPVDSIIQGHNRVEFTGRAAK